MSLKSVCRNQDDDVVVEADAKLLVGDVHAGQAFEPWVAPRPGHPLKGRPLKGRSQGTTFSLTRHRCLCTLRLFSILPSRVLSRRTLKGVIRIARNLPLNGLGKPHFAECRMLPEG